MTSARIDSRRASLVVAITVAVFAAAACQYPRDPEGTLERVEGGELRVGVVDDPPWVVLGKGEPRGIEPELVRRFATELDAEIQWFEGPEAELVEAMRGFQLDLIVGNFTRSSPWSRYVALTRPYHDTQVEVGVPPGEELPEDLAGLRIWVEEGSEPAALLRQEEDDAEPVYFEDLDEVEGPALLDSYDIDTIGYERTGYILRDDEHAMAVPMGENAFLVELERFLLDRGREVGSLLAEWTQR